MSEASEAYIQKLDKQRIQIEHRLLDGWNYIASAESLGKNVTAWEDFWFTLLNEYMSICDEMMAEA